MVKERRPIFINAFAHGGSNILWNILQSHPRVCSPIYETHELFQGTAKGLFLSFANLQKDLFVSKNYKQRKIFNSMEMIDGVFHKAKMSTLNHEYNRCKEEDVLYSIDEIKKTRLAAKNLNGIIFLSDVLNKLYPDILFINLTRDPIALYEGYERRNLVKSVDEFIDFYQSVADEMTRIKEKYNSFFVKFEDIINHPQKSVKEIFSQSGLDVNQVKKIRLKMKPHYKKENQRIKEFPKGTKKWFSFDDLPKIICPKVNKYQKQRVDNLAQERILKKLGESGSKIGYSYEK